MRPPIRGGGICSARATSPIKPLHFVVRCYQVLFAGHSQGGWRASAASMWLRNVDNAVYRTYSFAGTGTQCAARRFSMVGSSSNGLLDYLDPMIAHPQVVTYRHPLDTWGNMDYANGRVCTYGTKALKDSSDLLGQHLLRTFEKLVGYSGPQIVVREDVSKNALLSRYWAHSLWSAPVWYCRPRAFRVVLSCFFGAQPP